MDYYLYYPRFLVYITIHAHSDLPEIPVITSIYQSDKRSLPANMMGPHGRASILSKVTSVAFSLIINMCCWLLEQWHVLGIM